MTDFFGIILARTLGKKRVFTYIVTLFLVSVKVDEMDGERIGNIVRLDHKYFALRRNGGKNMSIIEPAPLGIKPKFEYNECFNTSEGFHKSSSFFH